MRAPALLVASIAALVLAGTGTAATLPPGSCVVSADQLSVAKGGTSSVFTGHVTFSAAHWNRKATVWIDGRVAPASFDLTALPPAAQLEVAQASDGGDVLFVTSYPS